MNTLSLSTVGHDKVSVPPSLTVLTDDDAVAPDGFRCFRILSEKSGDDRVVWDADDLTQIREAKQLFLELIKKGLTPYQVGTNGKATSKVMTKFDATAEEVIFLPTQLVVGG